MAQLTYLPSWAGAASSHVPDTIESVDDALVDRWTPRAVTEPGGTLTLAPSHLKMIDVMTDEQIKALTTVPEPAVSETLELIPGSVTGFEASPRAVPPMPPKPSSSLSPGMIPIPVSCPPTGEMRLPELQAFTRKRSALRKIVVFVGWLAAIVACVALGVGLAYVAGNYQIL